MTTRDELAKGLAVLHMRSRENTDTTWTECSVRAPREEVCVNWDFVTCPKCLAWRDGDGFRRMSP